MKILHLIFTICFCGVISAQEAATPPQTAQQPAPLPNAAAAPSAPQEAATSATGAPPEPAAQTGQSPLSLGGLSSADNSAILNMLNSQANLTDLTGKKVDDAQQRLIRSRFEKYLNTPPAASADDIAYNQLLVDISQRLAGKGGGSDNERTIDAWRMLFNAENYPMDDNLCRTIADKVVNFWQTTRKIERLLIQNEELEKDRTRKEAGVRVISSMDRREFIEMMRGKDATPPPSRDYEMDPIKKRIAETEAKIQENKSYEATSRVNQKLDFQSLIVQFFIQRRYYHAMITNDFYRYLFAAEDAKIEGVDALKGEVFGGIDIKLTTASIDALCKEAINDTERAVEAVKYLVSRGELHSATQRLMEAFFIGENLAPVKTFPMDAKREIMRYMRDTDKLINAVKVKHVERAEEILKEILTYVKDFDPGQIEAFIETSRQLSNLALQRALVCAQSKNQPGVEAALKEAVEFWPTNPEIQKFLKTMVSRLDIKDVAVSDFDRLLSQKDFRGIFNDRFRFAAALAADNARNGKFLEIMKQMEIIETAMSQAKELVRQRNDFAAWEIIEKVYRQFPEDANLNKMRADLTVNASQFASAIANAERAAQSGKLWPALLLYIKAREIYPFSSIANDEISKLAKKIIGE